MTDEEAKRAIENVQINYPRLALHGFSSNSGTSGHPPSLQTAFISACFFYVFRSEPPLKRRLLHKIHCYSISRYLFLMPLFSADHARAHCALLQI